MTFEYRPHPQLILKLEARYDHPPRTRSRPSADDPKHDQKLLALGAVATF